MIHRLIFIAFLINLFTSNLTFSQEEPYYRKPWKYPKSQLFQQDFPPFYYVGGITPPMIKFEGDYLLTPYGKLKYERIQNKKGYDPRALKLIQEDASETIIWKETLGYETPIGGQIVDLHLTDTECTFLFDTRLSIEMIYVSKDSAGLWQEGIRRKLLQRIDNFEMDPWSYYASVLSPKTISFKFWNRRYYQNAVFTLNEKEEIVMHLNGEDIVLGDDDHENRLKVKSNNVRLHIDSSIQYPHHLFLKLTNKYATLLRAPRLDPNGLSFYILDHNDSLLLRKQEEWTRNLDWQDYLPGNFDRGQTIKYIFLPHLELKKQHFPKGEYRIYANIQDFKYQHSDTLSFYFDPAIDYEFGKERVQDKRIVLEMIEDIRYPDSMIIDLKNNTQERVAIGKNLDSQISFVVKEREGKAVDLTEVFFAEEIYIAPMSTISFIVPYQEVLKKAFEKDDYSKVDIFWKLKGKYNLGWSFGASFGKR